MTPSSFAPAASRSDLLGPHCGELVLRLCNTIHQGRLMRLSAAKCTIGSARDATLRLHGAGVAPTHCLILRGQNQTVIRRWARDTRLNDQPITDAPLKAGDRIGLGAIELEVVSNPSDEAPEVAITVDLPTGNQTSTAAELAERQRQLDEQALSLAHLREEHQGHRERLEAQSVAWQAERAAWEYERTVWIAERAAAESALAEQRASLAREAEAFARQADESSQERRALEGEKKTFAKRRQALDRETKKVEQLQRDLESREQSLAAERLALQAEAASTQTAAGDSLAAERQSLELLNQSLETEREVMKADRKTLCAERDTLKAEREALLNERQSLAVDQDRLGDERQVVVAKQQELARDRESLRDEWQALDMQLQGLAAEGQIIASQRQSLEVQQQQFANEQQALATARQVLEAERRAVESQRSQTSAETAQKAQRIAEQTAAFAASREAFERQRELWQAERDQFQTRIIEELERCQHQLAELNRLREDFDRERTAWDERRQSSEAELAARRDVLDRQTGELEAHGRRLEAQQAALAGRELSAAQRNAAFLAERPRASLEADRPETSHAVPDHSASGDAGSDDAHSEEEVFARLRSYAMLKPDPQEESVREAGPRGAHGAEPRPSARSSDAEPAQLAERDLAAMAPHAGNEEESVDDYMARLLNRIRGISGPSGGEPVPRPTPRPAPVEPPPTVAPRPVSASSDGVQDEEPPRPPVAPTPTQLVARSAPPELASNLKAMRELANMTARGAIEKHAHGRWSKAAVGKTVGGLVSLVCGIWLTFFQSTSLGALSLTAGMAGMLAGIFWISQAGWLARNLRRAGRRTTKFLEAEAHAAGHDGESRAADAQISALDPADDRTIGG